MNIIILAVGVMLVLFLYIYFQHPELIGIKEQRRGTKDRKGKPSKDTPGGGGGGGGSSSGNVDAATTEGGDGVRTAGGEVETTSSGVDVPADDATTEDGDGENAEGGITTKTLTDVANKEGRFFEEGEYFFTVSKDCEPMCKVRLGIDQNRKLGFAGQGIGDRSGPDYNIKHEHPLYLTPAYNEKEVKRNSSLKNLYHISRIDRKVYFYDYFNFNKDGKHTSRGPGEYNINDLKYNNGRQKMDNDTVSSIHVPPGMMVEMYEHDNWNGKKRDVVMPVERFPNFENKMTSSKVYDCTVEKKPGCFTEDRHKNYLAYSAELGLHFNDYWDSPDVVEDPPIWKVETNQDDAELSYAFRLHDNCFTAGADCDLYLHFSENKTVNVPISSNRIHFSVAFLRDSIKKEIQVVTVSETPTWWRVEKA